MWPTCVVNMFKFKNPFARPQAIQVAENSLYQLEMDQLGLISRLEYYELMVALNAKQVERLRKYIYDNKNNHTRAISSEPTPGEYVILEPAPSIARQNTDEVPNKRDLS